MTKLLKVTAKLTASMVLFSAIGITLINAAVNVDALSIGSALLTLLMCNNILDAIWS